MKALQLFDFDGYQVRTVTDEQGEPWFVLKDVCDVLEISNPSQAKSRLNREDWNTLTINEGIGNPNKTVINESGLYDVILDSRKPQAKQFRRWVTGEVLPQIRKSGAYVSDTILDSEDPLDMLQQALDIAREERAKKELAEQKAKALEAKVEADAPKVNFADKFQQSKSTLTITELAKNMAGWGLVISGVELAKRMRKDGFLYKNQVGKSENLPIKKWEEKGYLVSAPRHYWDRVNEEHVPYTRAEVTTSGLKFFIEYYTGINTDYTLDVVLDESN